VDVVILEPPPAKTLLGRFDRVRVVVAENPCPAGIVQRERIANSMWNAIRRLNRPRLDLDPIAATLNQNLAVQIEQRV
jgi:hypothetical protein